LKLDVSTILEKIAIEVPLDKPNWEKEREFLLKRPVFLKENKDSKKEQDNNFRKN